MGSNKVVIAGLLVALALVGSVAAEKKCENASGKQDCSHDLKKDETLYVKCPDSATFVPANAFQSKSEKVCKKAIAELAGSCDGADAAALDSLVPGVEVTHPDGNKKYEFKVVNKKELSADMPVYATCRAANNTDGFIIKIKFLKGGSSDASSRATMPAVMLGALTTLVVMFRA